MIYKFLKWLIDWKDKKPENVEEPEFVKIIETGETCPYPESNENWDKINQETRTVLNKKTEKTKESSFDTSSIQEYKGTTTQQYEFRPQTWNQFIGQTEAKARAKTIIKKINQHMKAHFLVDGIKGHGKTTFVELLAKNINAHIIKRIGKQIDEENLVDIINEINSSKKENVLFFIDEIDSMDWKIIKILNPIIESFEIEGKKIKPFIFAGATINKHILIKNNPDTLDRIPSHIKFIRYNDLEIATILKQYKKQLYPTINCPEYAIDIISKNCKFNPRTAISLLEETLVEQDVTKVLHNCQIVKNGLTKKDIEILQTLVNTPRAMGANALAMKCGISQNEYIQEYEPYLIEYELINRIPSRIITDFGKQLLERI